MKKIVFAAFAAAIAVPAAAAPGDSDSTSGAATAEIVSPIAITHDPADELNFGTIVPGTAAGTVTVDAATGVATGDAEATVLSGAVSSADFFTVTGEDGRGFDIATTGGSVVSGANSMAFTTAPSAATGTLAGGTATFTVGGALSVAASQASGVYAGTYSATVAYN